MGMGIVDHPEGGIAGYEMQAVDDEVGERFGQWREDADQVAGYPFDAS